MQSKSNTTKRGLKFLSAIKSFLLHPIWHYSPTKIATLVKADWNDEIVPVEHLKKVQKDFADLMAGKTTVHDLAVKNGALTMEVSTELVRVMADQFLKLLDENKAVNYLEYGFKRRGEVKECVTVCLQRVDKMTPHQFRLEAERKQIVAMEMLKEIIRAYNTSEDMAGTIAKARLLTREGGAS